jgi:hypothetical protein
MSGWLQQRPVDHYEPTFEKAETGHRLNHLLLTAKTGRPTEYSVIEEFIAPTALAVIVDWVAQPAR